jgi:GcrA cell cycle regulator
MVWTVDKIDKLRQLWGKGDTANQIAQIIGDVTRNAVIGKANRLNLSNKLSPKSTINSSNSFHKKNQLTYLKEKR